MSYFQYAVKLWLQGSINKESDCIDYLKNLRIQMSTLEQIQYIYRQHVWPSLYFSVKHVGQWLTKSYLLTTFVDWIEKWDLIFGLKNKMSRNEL